MLCYKLEQKKIKKKSLNIVMCISSHIEIDE